jgi:transcriptional regulator with XRE-family HTH domain
MTIAISNYGNKQTFAKNLNKYIAMWEDKGYTKEMIAKELGVPVTTFAGWYRGEYYPRIDKIEKMAEFFNTTKSCLVEEYSLTPVQNETVQYLITSECGEEILIELAQMDAKNYERLLSYMQFLNNGGK